MKILFKILFLVVIGFTYIGYAIAESYKFIRNIFKWIVN